MTDNKYVGESIEAGQFVYVDDSGLFEPFTPADGHCQPIGTAKRRIAKGELIVYSPGHDTDDIEAVIRIT